MPPPDLFPQTSPVAQEIACQIGEDAFRMMGTGSQSRFADGDDLFFSIKGCSKYNRIRVSLSDMDTYTVTFLKFRSFEKINEKVVSGVYNDQLRPVIEAETGLSLTMPKVIFLK